MQMKQTWAEKSSQLRQPPLVGICFSFNRALSVSNLRSFYWKLNIFTREAKKRSGRKRSTCLIAMATGR